MALRHIENSLVLSGLVVKPADYLLFQRERRLKACST
jgi:hypothetical protein